MTVKLNDDALAFARTLVRDGKVVHDKHDAWSADAPSTAEQNQFLKKDGWDAYARWHLGIDTSKSAQTKGRYSFPFGDFSKVHRCAVIALESRAAQNGHEEIATASKNLLRLIDS